MAATGNTTENAPMPKEGGSYVRQGEELQRVEHTGPAKDAPATEPAAQSRDKAVATKPTKE